ncbi:NAD-dependent protein deacylase-like [Hydractinia symbiolongicarpus]|uniref:NAD-dependent protein deacylase-like n=1 Tax=Hydractinia symbiolongicarpus TaxID=13093 RepID=UPI002551AB38|nr:NAD-dependent protein deacylase-like [Hydractinia symbiolongicarpus]XP_057300963.1 NAD-dependent protein deacylase-like [Hydractinia symbiolongicarpus]
MKLNFQRAASVIKNAKALIITAGAGMGVDSGLPDFRGPEGFWKAYPPIKQRRLTLPEMSTPSWFESDPQFAWGFFGHRLLLYRNTQPHHGFQILKKWGEKKEFGYFVYTSNVDGHFQKAGFSEERVVECHGSIHFMQPTKSYNYIWPTPEDLEFVIDNRTLKAQPPLPTGPPGLPIEKQVMGRPNILMFGDAYWLPGRTDDQEERFYEWVKLLQKQPVVVVEIGAGLAVPTIRNTSQGIIKYSRHEDSYLIRINPNEPQVIRPVDFALPMNCLDALEAIDAYMDK